MTVNTTLIWTLRDQVSGTANKINNSLDQVGVKSKGATGALGKLGVATGGLVTPTTLAAAGALALAGGLVHAGRAAIEEEKNIAGLDAALRANVVGFDGNTDAIERTIAAREALAFTDDELRNSLKLLVGATKDVDKAMALQATAMDLARFSGKSLEEASQALIRIEGGQFRALKTLIGSTKDIKTEQQALAAVQKVAAGAAKAYGETTAGALEAANIAVEDLNEDIGEGLLPTVKDLAVALRTDVIPALRDTASGASAFAEVLPDGFWDGVISGLTFGTSGMLEYANAERRAADEAEALADATTVSGDTLRVQLTEDLRGVEDATDDTGDSFSDLANAAGQAANDMTTAWVKAASDMIGKAYDPLIEHEQLLADQVEINALERIASKRALTAEERQNLAELQKSEADHLLALAEAGQTTSGAFENGIADLKEQIGKASGPTKTYLQNVLDYLLRIKANSRIPLSFPTNIGNLGNIGGARASGGPVSANTPYIVGEEGPEMFVPGTSGTIIANGASVPMSGGGASVVHTHIYLDGRQIAESVDRHQFNRLQRAPVTAGRV